MVDNKKDPLKNVYIKTPSKTKSYTFRISENLHSRVHHLKDLTRSRKDIDINNSLDKHLFEIVVALEKKLGITKEDWKTPISCPECGSKLKERVSKTGSKFFGCSNYPTCKFTKAIK